MRRSSRNPFLVYSLGIVLLFMLLGLDILSAQSIFTSLYQAAEFAQPRYHTLSEGISIALVGILLIYISIYRISDKFILLSKSATALAIPLLMVGCVSLGVQVSLPHLIGILLLLLNLSSFCSSYQQEDCPHLYLRIGLSLFGLCFTNSLFLVYLPLFIYSSYVQKSNSLRNILAFLIGLIAPASIICSYLLYEYSPTGIIPILEQYIQPISDPSPINLSSSLHWGIMVITFLGLLALFSYGSGGHTESIRQRAQGAMLVAWAVYSLIVLVLYPSPTMLLLPLMSLSVIGARGLDLLPQKALRLSLTLLGVLSILGTLLI